MTKPMKHAVAHIFATTYNLDEFDLSLLLNIPIQNAKIFLNGDKPTNIDTIRQTEIIVENRINDMKTKIINDIKQNKQFQNTPMQYAMFVFNDTQTMFNVIKTHANPNVNPADCIASLHKIAVWRAIKTLNDENITLHAILYDKNNPPPKNKVLNILEQPQKKLKKPTIH